MSITVYPHPSVELLRAVLSVFSHLGEASEEQLCAEIEHDLTLLEWDLKAFSIWLLCLVCLWLLTSLQLVRMELIRFVSPLLQPPSPTQYHKLQGDCKHLFMHSFLIWYLLSSFYVSLLDLMETLKNKTQYFLSRNTILETKRKFLQIK